MPSSLRQQQGLSLIEVLVAAVILAFGVVGTVYLQMFSLRSTVTANNTQIASVAINSLAEQIRVSTLTDTEIASYASFTPSTTNCASPSGLHQSDICAAWEAISRLRDGALTITSDACGSSCVSRLTLTASWTQQIETGAETNSYSVEIIPPKKGY